MKLLHDLGYGVVVKGEQRKATKETLRGMRKDGFVIVVEYCLPDERDEAVKIIFENYSRVCQIQIMLLNGKFKMINR